MKYYMYNKRNDNVTVEIGEDSFGTFYADDGYRILIYNIRQTPENLEDIVIINSQSEVLSLEEFFDILSKFKIRD